MIILLPHNTVSANQHEPRPLAEGVGEGSQLLHEGVRAQGLSRAKYNKIEKIRRADFFLLYVQRNDLTTTSLQSVSGC